MMDGWRTFLLICLAAFICAAPGHAQSATTTTVSSDRNPSDRPTLRIVVTAANGARPEGTVDLYENSTLLTTLTLGFGQAQFDRGHYSAYGNYTYRAVYTPADPSLWQTSTSDDYVVVSGDPGTSLTRVSASANPAGYHQPVTFTARVSANLSVYDGEVAWTIDGSSQGTTLVSRIGSSSVGQATLTVPAGTLSLGSHTVRADFSHANSDLPFFRTSFDTLKPDLMIVKEPTTTALGSSLNPSIVGQAVTLTGTVAGAGSPTGDVTFLVDGQPAGVVALSSGSATFGISNLTVGSHDVVVSYPGDATHQASLSSILVQVVNQITAGIGLTSSLNPSISGDDVTFTATITGASPTGTVTFSTEAATLGTSNVVSGQATLTTSALAPGTYTVTAQYSGDSNHAAISTSLSPQSVNKRTATVNLTSTANPLALGDSVTIAANVTGAGPTPTGNIVFIIDGTPLMLQNLEDGSTSVKLDGLSGGTHTVSASYSGDGEYSDAVGSLTGGQTVDAASTTATLISSQNPATRGTPVTFTANFSARPEAGSPTGEVTFSVNNVAQPPVALANGTATFTSSDLPVGTTAITVDYPGNSDFLASSAALDQTVDLPIPIPPEEVVSFALGTITAPLAIEPGQNGQFVIEVSNTGNVTDTYQLSLAGDGAITLPLNQLQVTAGGTAQFLINVSVPPEASSGQLSSTLTVISTANSRVRQSWPLSVEVTASTATRTFEVALRPGWNAVGFPVSRVLSIAPNAQIAGLSFYQDGAYDVAPLSPQATHPTVRGYWVFARSATTLEFTGVQPASGRVPLASGWNLVHFPFDGPLPASRLSFDNALVLDEVYEVMPDNSYEIRNLGTDVVFTPGRLCWVFATAATEITY